MSLDASQQHLDPNASFVSTSCLDLLLIEIVPMAERITQDLLVRSTTEEQGGEKGAAGAAGAVPVPDDELREATFYRLELLGYRVGQGLAERYLSLSLSLFCLFQNLKITRNESGLIRELCFGKK